MILGCSQCKSRHKITYFSILCNFKNFNKLLAKYDYVVRSVSSINCPIINKNQFNKAKYDF